MASRACSIWAAVSGDCPATFRPTNTVRPSPARTRLTSARYPAMMPLASSAFTRRRQADGESEMASARSTLAMRPSRWSLATMARSTLSGRCSGMESSLEPLSRNAVAQQCPLWRHICHRVRAHLGDGGPMALTDVKQQPVDSRRLTTSRGAALYIGAILGPGLLLLPGLAAAEAGPASILAWIALLGLSGLFAAVFSALGRHNPSAGGVIGCAPIVCLIGAGYVTELTGGGQLDRAAVAAVLLLTVLGLAAGGLRASATAQLVLVSLLIGVVVVAVTGSAPAARAANWTPFAPHGWVSIGNAAAMLMFSFAGWEAVAPLTTRFANPSRQLPRAVAIALAVTTALYLGLAIATISVLGPQAATDVPLAGLLSHTVGAAGPAVAAVAAVVLTLGATNAYINGAAAMAGQLMPAAPGRRSAPMHRLLAAIAAAGLLL